MKSEANLSSGNSQLYHSIYIGSSHHILVFLFIHEEKKEDQLCQNINGLFFRLYDYIAFFLILTSSIQFSTFLCRYLSSSFDIAKFIQL